MSGGKFFIVQPPFAFVPLPIKISGPILHQSLGGADLCRRQFDFRGHLEFTLAFLQSMI